MGKYIDRDGDEWVIGCVYCAYYNKSGIEDKCDALREKKSDQGAFNSYFFDSDCNCPNFIPKQEY